LIKGSCLDDIKTRLVKSKFAIRRLLLYKLISDNGDKNTQLEKENIENKMKFFENVTSIE